MITCFFVLKGHIEPPFFSGSKTVNVKMYTKKCLPKAINEIRENNVDRRITLHQENTSSYTAREIINYLKNKNIKIMSHCPRSSDLLLNDFFLFPYIKQKVLGGQFSSPQESVDAFKNHISVISTSE